MAQTLPLTHDADYYEFTTTLGGIDYDFAVNYNDRDQLWYLSLADSEGAEILSGAKLCVGAELLHACPDVLRKPKGALVVLDTSGKGVEAGRDELGERVIVVFIPLAELS